MKKAILLLGFMMITALLAGCDTGAASYPQSTFALEEEVSESVDSSMTRESSQSTSVSHNSTYPFIHIIYGDLNPVICGPRKYVGAEPFRVYPGADSPYIYGNYRTDTVQVIHEVSTGDWTNPDNLWCLVTDSYMGYAGYVQSTDLQPIEETCTYGNVAETIGGFKLGDRVETLIGLLDQDYSLIYDHGQRAYQFPDGSATSSTGESLNLRVFSDSTNHVCYLRTSSPKFALKDGYKPGDDANTVLEYYKKKYKLTMLSDSGTYETINDFYFLIIGGYYLQFHIDTETLTKYSKIDSISIIPEGLMY